MAGFCVILSGRFQDDRDDASVWAPISAAFKLDEASFAQRVLAAMPLIVRQNLDEPAAEKLAERLHASGISARVEPEDTQLAYFEREGTTRGPVPSSALRKFIRSQERYRLSGEKDWKVWEDKTAFDDALFCKILSPPMIGLDDETPPPLPQQEEPPPPPFLTGSAVPVADARTAVASGSDIEEEMPPPLPMQDDPVAETYGKSSPTIETALPKDLSKGSAPIQQPSDRSPIAFRQSRKPPPSSSRVGLWLAAAVIIAIAAGAFAWFHLSHSLTPLTAQLPPASAAPPASASISKLPQAQAVVPPQLQPQPAASAAVSTAAAEEPSQASSINSNLALVSPAVTPAAAVAPLAESSVTDHCVADAPKAQSPEEVTLLADGQSHLVGRSVRAGSSGEIYIVEAALGYDGVCRPSPYQLYVFNHGKLVGTLVPQAMQARTDGAISDFKLIDPEHLQIEIEHYKPNDPACCASSHEQRIVDLSQFGGARSATPSSTPLPIASAGEPAVVAKKALGNPSFDCAKAISPTDSAICGDIALSNLDVQVATMYRQAVAQASTDNAGLLKDDQRQWLRNRARCGTDTNCIERQSSARVTALQRYIVK
jgi:uncharacterized protein YecT (DUF1311 family)